MAGRLRVFVRANGDRVKMEPARYARALRSQRASAVRWGKTVWKDARGRQRVGSPKQFETYKRRSKRPNLAPVEVRRRRSPGAKRSEPSRRERPAPGGTIEVTLDLPRMVITGWRSFGQWVKAVWDLVKESSPGPTAQVRMIIEGFADGDRGEAPVNLDVTVPLTRDLGRVLARKIDAALIEAQRTAPTGGGSGGGAAVIPGSSYEDDDAGSEPDETDVLDRGDLDALVQINLGNFPQTPPRDAIDASELEAGGDLTFRR